MPTPAHHAGRTPARRGLRAACAASVLLVSLGAAPAVAAAAKPARPPALAPVSAAFFGVHHQGLHVDGPSGFPQAPVGSVRIWDNGVSWREIETAPGVFDWTRLDAEVAKVASHGASVLLVLGQTPTFASTRPTAASTYGPGASTMPRRDAWVSYVRAVAERNRTVWGGAASFQVWNEANVVGYWSGTPKEMATLTAWTDQVLRSADPNARLVAPALVARLSSQRRWADAYFSQSVAGRNVSAYVDALSFQLYPVAPGSPEAGMRLLTQVRAVLARHKVRKPIWNTEVNYGMVSGAGTARPASSKQQVANVIRTYTLNAENGVARVYWYSWDLLNLGNTAMVQSDRTTLTAAGQAFTTTRRWLLGARPTGCTTTRDGTWTCSFVTRTETRRVMWNPRRVTTAPAPIGTRTVAAWNSAAVTHGRRAAVTVGPVPVLVVAPR